MQTPPSWRARLAAHKAQSKVIAIPERMRAKSGEGTIAIPDAREVDAAMARVPLRKLATPKEIGESIARKHGATIGCTVTTGILMPLVASAAHEAEQAGMARVTPYWRALKTNGELNAKYPGGIDDLKARLESEGHTVVQKGARFFVQDYAARLAKL